MKSKLLKKCRKIVTDYYEHGYYYVQIESLDGITKFEFSNYSKAMQFKREKILLLSYSIVNK